MKTCLILLFIFFNGIIAAASVADNINHGISGFIENKGQLLNPDNGKIVFYTGHSDSRLYAFRDRLSFVFCSFTDSAETDDREISFDKIDINFLNIDNNCEITFADPSGYVLNYYLAQCPDGITGVKSYSKVTYHNIYKNIDLVLYQNGSSDELKYEFIVNPGGNPSEIQLKYSGADKLTRMSSSCSEASNEMGFIRDEGLTAYTVRYKNSPDETLENTSASFALSGNVMSFKISNYDKTKPLVIDPTLMWSTFYGGARLDVAKDVIVDNDNNLVYIGFSTSADYKTTTGVFQTTNKGLRDIVLSKMDDTGKLIWATYFGGKGDDFGEALVCSKNNDLFITGWTWSLDFPTTANAFNRAFSGPYDKGESKGTDGIIARFNKNGQLVWSTYFGGEMDEHFYDIDIYRNEEIALTGFTNSSSFPVTDTLFIKFLDDINDAFLIRMNLDGQLYYSNFFGGEKEDEGRGIEYDIDGEIVFTGFTESPDFPLMSLTSNDKSFVEGIDAFVARFSTSGTISTQVSGKVYGGAGSDRAYDLTLDGDRNILLAGETNSSDMPVKGNSFQPIFNGLLDAFVIKTNTEGRIIWSTYFGGSNFEAGHSIIADINNNVIVAGRTKSDDFPVTPGNINDIYSAFYDGFVFKFTPNGDSLFWSTFIGGKYDDRAWDVATDFAQNIIVVGETESHDFHITDNAIQKDYGGISDAFILKLCKSEPLPGIVVSGDIPFCPGDSVILTATGGFREYYWPGNRTGRSIVVKKAGLYQVTVVDSSGCSGTSDTLEVFLFDEPDPDISGDLEICAGDTTELYVENDFLSYEWGSGEKTRSIKVWKTGTYTVKVVDDKGCTGEKSVKVNVNPLPEPMIIGPKEVCAFTKNSFYRIDGYPTHSYVWSAQGGNMTYGVDSINILVDWGGTGTGKVFVKDSNEITGCIGYDTLEVKITEELEPEIKSSTNSFSFCDGDSIILDAGNYDEYLWSTSETERTIVVKESGEYYVMVTDISGCDGYDTVFVTKNPLPEPEVRGNMVFCQNETGSFSTEWVFETLYDWEVTNGNIISGQGSSSINVDWLAPGSATIVVSQTVPSTGCTGVSEEFVVTVLPVPEPEIGMIGDTVFCDGDSVILYIADVYDSYKWSTGSTEQSITVFDSGNYSATVTNIEGCSNSPDNAINVTVYPNPPKPIISVINTKLRSTPADFYQWNFEGSPVPGAVAQEHDPQLPGYYTVTITDINGCSAESDPVWGGSATFTAAIEDTVFVNIGERAEIDVELLESFNLENVNSENFTVYLSYNRTILLPLGNFTFIGQSGDFESIAVSGKRKSIKGLLQKIDFTTLWGNAACTPIRIDSISWDDDRISGEYINGVLCLADLCYAGGTRLYFEKEGYLLENNKPNPFADETEIRFITPEKGIHKIHFVDIMGSINKVIFQQELDPGDYTVPFSAKDLPSGIYFYILEGPSERLIGRMEIIK